MEFPDFARTSSDPQVRLIAKADPVRLSDAALTMVDRYRYWLMAGILVIYLVGFNGQWRVERDSALYLSVGRNLAEGRGPTYRDQPNHLVFPGLPYLLDATFRTFHTESLLPAEVVMLLLGFITLGLTYRLFLLYAGRPTAVVMMIGLGLTRLFYRYCFEILTDLPFLLGVMAFLAGYEAIFYRRPAISSETDADADAESGPSRAKWYDWALLVGGLCVAISMRPVMWALLAAVVMALGWRVVRGKINLLHILVTVGVIAAVAIFYVVDWGRRGPGVDDYEIAILSRLRHFHAEVAEIPHNLWELFPEAALVKAMFGCRLPLVLNFGLGVMVFILTFTLFHRRVLWGFLVMVTFAMLLLFQQPLERYFLPVIPLLVYSWWQFLVWLNHKLPANWGNWCFLALFFSGLGCNFARIGEMVVEQRRRPFLAYYHDGRYQSLDRMSRWVDNHTTSADWILAAPDHGRILTFKTRRNVVEPTEKVVVDPQHLFVLVGPGWDENVDGRKKPADSTEDRRKKHRTIAAWLADRGLQVGAPASSPFMDINGHEPWILYRTAPLP